MNIEQARFNMIEQQIRPGTCSTRPCSRCWRWCGARISWPPAYRALAFCDIEIPLPEGQCMLTPRIEARLLQEAQVQRHERVLEIGAGSGFMAALLAHRAQAVVTLERVPVLARMAAENLRRAGVVNASVREMDGRDGLAAEAPFDVIVLSGSVASVPSALLQQLRVGGRLIGIVGAEPMMRALRVTRNSDAAFATVELFDTVAPRLAGFDEPTRFTF